MRWDFAGSTYSHSCSEYGTVWTLDGIVSYLVRKEEFRDLIKCSPLVNFIL